MGSRKAAATEVVARRRRFVIAIALFVQACLMFARLDLLSLWGDELFTLRTVTSAPGTIIQILRADIHPPLYYLLVHYWIRIPLPLETVLKIRAFSGLCILLATFLMYRLWLRDLRPVKANAWLCLWICSPCILLYGRMGRSYAMQALVSIVTVWCFWNFRRVPNVRNASIAVAAGLTCLYTHYVPGIAICAAFTLLLFVEGYRKREWAAMKFWCAATIAILIGYVPWLMTLLDALTRWSVTGGVSAAYLVTGSVVKEHALKIAFATYSLLFGETPGGIIFFIGVLVGVTVLSLAWREWMKRYPEFFWFWVATVGIGYLGVSRWVSYPFVPARLLWILPFVLFGIATHPMLRRRWMFWLLYPALVFPPSLIAYFSGTGFINKGYAAPWREIAETVAQNGGGTVYVDTYNTDADTFAYYSRGRMRIFELKGVTGKAAEGRIWILRSEHDLSPNHESSKAEARLCDGRERNVRQYVPFQWEEGVAMRMAGMGDPPSYFLRLAECR